ncbi:ROK family transcriptional regulator [Kutzneria buriramensis]|uniref:Putative NBD/HSP70 family sugar kinase n=1 Tax=Kutzneria buriramensis TaxID=1045776 RepID=A0A3E0HQB0_9PSEU|nr:ROK family transcriptional regulator [Kutzneria buriramensis]REH48195.1 putative NBD/HSP70 family sugar kinase [Kutzneria buriramensis]
MSGPATVLRAVLRHGPVARSTIARLTGLSPAGVTRHCGSLADRGLVAETDGPVSRNGMGRPHVPVDIDTARHTVCGVHIAHAQCTLAVLDLRGNVLAQQQIPHGGTRPEEVLGTVVEALPRFLGDRRPLAMGVAAGGWVDTDNGVIVEHASLGWKNVPVKEILSTTGIPVHADSHARALVQAEQLFGQVRASESVLHLFVGNVVDAAIVTGGSTHRGPRSAAGDVAHLPLGDPDVRCGRGHQGCFEATVSDDAWARRTAGVSMRELLGAKPDPFIERARMVGRAAALLYDVVNPEVLVVTEAGVIHFPECLQALRDEIAARSHLCAAPEHTVLSSSFGGDEVLAVAGGAVALGVLYADPLSHAVG